jgi:asparagine synthase (glutamine-hydrolysing)
MRIQGIGDGKARDQAAPIIYPLLSQPVVELCLGLPSWMWIARGRNRSIARDAFADGLPALVRSRRSKGDFTAFCGAIYARQHKDLSEILLDGWLAREGVLDREAIEAYLGQSGPPRDAGFYRLLDIAGVEMWARGWANGMM